MKRLSAIGAALAVAYVGVVYSGNFVNREAAAAPAPETPTGVERLYVLDCGVGHAADVSRWTIGFNAGKPVDISVECYLIRHKQGYFLFDTGISDHVTAMMPNGWLRGTNPATDITWRRAKTLMSQLKQLNVTPADIKFIGISHSHPDHIGNVEQFPKTPLLIQKLEHDFFFDPKRSTAVPMVPPGDPTPEFKKDHPVQLVEEDLDVFKDGSVILFNTVGHTPGHQSALVHLAKTGWVMLSGDAVHLKDNWDHKRVPYFFRLSVEEKLQTAVSMQRMDDLLTLYRAQLWINHDKVQADAQKHAPAYYE